MFAPKPRAENARIAPRSSARRRIDARPPDLFAWAGVTEAAPEPVAFDPQKLVRMALGIWSASLDAQHAILCERWCKSQNLTLPDDVDGDVVRFHSRLSFDGGRTPGLLWLLRDLRTDEPTGVLRTFLDSDGAFLAQRVLGRAFSAAIKLDADEHVTEGLVLASSVETGIAAMNSGLRPVWCVTSAALLAEFPVMGVQCLTILANDTNAQAVDTLCARWRAAGREVFVVPNAAPRPPPEIANAAPE